MTVIVPSDGTRMSLIEYSGGYPTKGNCEGTLTTAANGGPNPGVIVAGNAMWKQRKTRRKEKDTG